MRLHLPKGLLAALLAACFASTVPLAEAEDNKVINDQGTDSITLPNQNSSPDRLLFDSTGSSPALITYKGAIESYGSHWCGPGKNDNGVWVYNGDGAAASYYIKLTGKLSGDGTLKFNDLSPNNTAGRNVVWDLAGIEDNSITYTGNFEVNHGAGDSSYAQLTLSGTFSGSNVVTLANNKTILHIANNVTLAGLVGDSAGRSVTAVAGATLTLNITGTTVRTYSGKLGTGSYFTESTTNDQGGTVAGYTSSEPGTDSAAVNLTKTGTGTQNLNGTNKFGTLNVEQGTLGLGGTTTLTGTTTVSSGATLSNTGTLTNNGSLTISGTYSGNTITNTGILTLADAAVVDVGRLTNTITETATTDAEGTAISGRVTVNGGFTLASGGTVNTADNVRFTYNGFSYSGSLSEAEGNLSGTISGGYYRVVADDEVSYSTATTEANISHIEVLGTLTGVKDSSITTSIPITGNGSVAVDGVLETHVADLDQFTGTISLTGTSTDNLAAIKFGNSNAHLTQVSRIRLNANSYISGWSNLNFNYNLEFNGGFLLANQGSWVGANHLLSDSSIQVHKSANITGAFTAEAGKVLSIQASTFSEGEANPVLTFSGTVGKLDGAILQIKDGVTVAVTGHTGGKAQIAGAIVVNAGGTLKLTGDDTLGYSTDNGNYTDSITMTGMVGKAANLTLTAYQTLSTNLVLNGHTSVSGSAVNSFGGSITVSGTNNVFSTELKVREAITINVQGESDTFELSGSVNKYINSNGHLEGSGTITKTGSGTLIVSGANNNYPRAVAVNDGTLELRSTFNPAKIDLRGTAGTENTPATYGSLKIAAGGSAQLDTSVANGLWMYENSSLILAKKDGDKSGGALSIGSYITIQADGEDASIHTTATSGNGNYTFGGTDYEFVNANVSITSTGTYKAKLTNVNLINSSTENATVTVENSGNTLRGVEATGGNINFAADAEVTGYIKIASGKSVVVNSGAALTHDGFTYDGSTIKTSNAGSALSLWNNAVITGGTLTQKANSADGYKEIGAALTNVKLVNTGEHVTWLTAQSDTLSGMEIAGTLRVGQDDRTFSDETQKLEGTFKKANVTVSGAATVTALKVDTESTLELAGQNTNSTITTLTGSGTLKTTAGKTTVSSASGFSGKLEATGGKLEATTTGSQSIAALTANGGNIDVFGVTSLTVKDMVIGDNSTVGVYSGAAASSTKGGLNISGSADAKASLTIGSGATLNTNLSLWNAKLTFQDGALAMGSSLTLIPDGSNELYINIGTMKAGESLTLFTGVNQFQNSADAATIDEASKVFGNLTASDFKLTYSGADNGGIVALVAQRAVPEPTTATLSLMALMGLAARRRRRKA